ncbi:MAG: molybdopterin molybdotransferase MoeA [Candidatus Bathyarchaeia archaeon]
MMRANRRVIKLLPYSDALKRLSDIFRNKAQEYMGVSVIEASGRILAEDIFANVNVPENNISLVDGFALKSEDTLDASLERPVKLRVIGKLYPWSDPSGINISNGQACYVTCGAPIPDGANSVVKIENVISRGEDIELKHSVKIWENVCLSGEDIKMGSLVLRRGEFLRPQDVGVLAGLGIKKVNVLRKPRVAIISTGDEILERSKRDPEVIANNYALIISGLISKIGGESIISDIAPDNVIEIKRKISGVLDKTDIVVTIGGCSLGEKDFVPEAVNSLGKPGVIFHGVMIKPGRVSGFGMIEGKPIVMLPGLFASTLAGFYLIFVPTMALYMGLNMDQLLLKVNAKIGQDIRADDSPYHVFLPVGLKLTDEGFIAEPVMDGPSSLSRFMKANGFILLPPRKGLKRGERVNVILFNSDELFKACWNSFGVNV